MKKTLSLLKIMKFGLSLFIDLSLFIYLVVASALAAASDVSTGTTTFTLVVAWFVWAAAVVLSALIIKGFRKQETWSDVKAQALFSFVLLAVGAFVLAEVNVLIIVLFALVLTEFTIREKAETSDGDAVAPPEPSHEEEELNAETFEPQQALPEPQKTDVAPVTEETPVKTSAKPERKVIAPKRRGDDAVPSGDALLVDKEDKDV